MFPTATPSWTRCTSCVAPAAIYWSAKGAKHLVSWPRPGRSYLELPYADPVALEATLPELDAMLDIFDSIKPLNLGPDPRLADLGVGERACSRNNPGSRVFGTRPADTPMSSGRHSPRAWPSWSSGAVRLTSRCSTTRPAPTRSAGRDRQDAGSVRHRLCMDAGHFLVGGGDRSST